MKWFARGPRNRYRHRLAGSDLFGKLSDRDLRTVEGFLHYRSYLAGEIVFDAGEPGQALYIVLTGKVAISLPGHHDKPVAELGEKAFFGELGMLDDVERTAQVRAVEPSEIAVLFRDDFEQLMQAHGVIASHIAMQLARHVGRRLRQMLDQQGRAAEQ
ncbi:cyclic nucleotide-binding domain-containing protein [Azonexus sp. IMCC34839]|uniref:cyclic nucleotide-binding domain-containing protein n=1 Tax=Azonexus sp. IMCC34839 TaxID=3133695 RepID=UPI00399B0E6F